MSTASSTGCSGRTSRPPRSAGRPTSRCSSSWLMTSACRAARSGSLPGRPGARSWSSSMTSSRPRSLLGTRASAYDRRAVRDAPSGAAASRAIGSVVRARGSHPRGHWFESSIAHQMTSQTQGLRALFLSSCGFRPRDARCTVPKWHPASPSRRGTSRGCALLVPTRTASSSADTRLGAPEATITVHGGGRRRVSQAFWPP